jgi:VCBS repeat-containing protein
LEPQSRQVIAGNQQGFVFMIQADENQNAAVMQLTDMSQYGHGLVQMIIIDHTLQNGDYIAIYDNEQPIVDALGNPQTIFKVFLVQDSDTILISIATLEGGDYTGGAYIARVSNIRMLSKQWNPYVKDDRNFHLAKIDFGVFKTTNGQITVDYYPSYTEFSMLTQASGNSMILGNGILETSAYPLYPLETMQTLLWHPIYFQTDGEAIQIYLYFTDVQITNPQIAFSPFELEGMVLYTQPTTARLQ